MLNSKPRYIVHSAWNRYTKDNNLSTAKKFPIEKMYEGRLRQVGKVMMGRCPFHEEKTPSFAIYPENNTWYCFACSSGGDAVTYYMKKTGSNFAQAVEELSR